MKKKLLVLAWPIGFVLFLLYYVTNKYMVSYPSVVAYPYLTVCAVLLLIGCFYYGYCMSKGEDPYKFN